MTDTEKLIRDFDLGSFQAEVNAYAPQERDDALARLESMARFYVGEDRLITSKDLAEKIRNEPTEKTLLSGIVGLDNILGGFRKKQVVVLSGITKHGKTSFALFLTDKLKESNPVWLPLEESAEELVRKSLERGKEPPFFFTPQSIPSKAIDWIERKMIEAKVKYNSQILVIDHLGFIVDNESQSDDNVAYRIERVCRSLRKLATKWDMCILLMAHLTKTEITRKPDFNDLKGASAIGQEADTVMLLWRHTKRENGEVIISNVTTLSVQANRRTGKTGNIQMSFNDGEYTEIEYNREEDYETKVEKW